MQKQPAHGRLLTQNGEIDLAVLLKIFWRKLWLILLVAIFCATTAGVITSVFIAPTYESGFTAFVNNKAESGNQTTVTNADTSAAESLANTYAEIHLYDRDGIDIDIDKNLKLNIDKVMVRVEVLTVKEIPVKIAVSGTPAEGYRLTGETSVEPGRIKIAGKKSTLETVDSVSIPSSELSVAGMRKDFVKNVDITKYLPEDVALASGQSSSIKVTIEITEKETEEE